MCSFGRIIEHAACDVVCRCFSNLIGMESTVGVGDDVDGFLDCMMSIIVKRYPSCVQESDLPVPRDGVDEQNDEGVKKVKAAIAALTWVPVDGDLRKFVQMRKFA